MLGGIGDVGIGGGGGFGFGGVKEVSGMEDGILTSGGGGGGGGVEDDSDGDEKLERPLQGVASCVAITDAKWNRGEIYIWTVYSERGVGMINIVGMLIKN